MDEVKGYSQFLLACRIFQMDLPISKLLVRYRGSEVSVILAGRNPGRHESARRRTTSSVIEQLSL
jgi:hypothetical protein